jgi:hypothetical protein
MLGVLAVLVVSIGAVAATTLGPRMGLFGGSDRMEPQAEVPQEEPPAQTLPEEPTGVPGKEENLSDEELERYGATGEQPPSEATAPSDEQPPELALLEEFGREYDEASRRGDWKETYSMLSDDGQAVFTEGEWSEAQQVLRERNGTPPPLASVEVRPNEEASDSPAKVILRYEDGAEETIEAMVPMAVTAEEELAGEVGPRRYLSDEEVKYFKGLLGDEGGTSNGGEDRLQSFVSEYYGAVSREDWSATYSMLDPSNKAEFSEEQWTAWQEARVAEDPSPGIESAEVKMAGDNYVLQVELTYDDGSKATVPMQVSAVDCGSNYGCYARLVTDEEIEYLEGLLGEGGTDTEEGAGEETAVEEAIRGHYEAIGDNDFEGAYSYFGPSFRAKTPQEEWISEEESYDIRSSTVYNVEVQEASEGEATATVEVSFEDSTGTPYFEIEWALVREGGEWKLDEVLSSVEGEI